MEISNLPQGHIANKWQSWTSNLGNLSPESLLFATMLGCLSKQIEKDCQATTRCGERDHYNGLKLSVGCRKEGSGVHGFQVPTPRL